MLINVVCQTPAHCRPDRLGFPEVRAFFCFSREQQAVQQINVSAQVQQGVVKLLTEFFGGGGG